MKKMLLVAAAALTLGSATAFADGGDWVAPNTPVLTQEKVNQNIAAALAMQRQAEAAVQQQQVATQRPTGHSFMLFSTSPSEPPSFNANFGGGGNG